MTFFKRRDKKLEKGVKFVKTVMVNHFVYGVSAGFESGTFEKNPFPVMRENGEKAP